MCVFRNMNIFPRKLLRWCNRLFFSKKHGLCLQFHQIKTKRFCNNYSWKNFQGSDPSVFLYDSYRWLLLSKTTTCRWNTKHILFLFSKLSFILRGYRHVDSMDWPRNKYFVKNCNWANNIIPEWNKLLSSFSNKVNFGQHIT